MKYKGPCIDCQRFKEQQYIKKRCIACYQKFKRYDPKYKPHQKYKGPCITCGSFNSTSGRFIKKMCEKCYGRFKTRGTPHYKEFFKGPCIACGSLDPGYSKYFQEKMCGKCYRHYAHKRDKPKKEIRYCVDCNLQLPLYGRMERCRNCRIKYRYANDKGFKNNILNNNKKYSKTPKGKLTSRTHNRKRRAILAKVENTLTKEEWLAILEKHNY